MFQKPQIRLKRLYVDKKSMQDAMRTEGSFAWTDFVLFLETLEKHDMQILDVKELFARSETINDGKDETEKTDENNEKSSKARNERENGNDRSNRRDKRDRNERKDEKNREDREGILLAADEETSLLTNQIDIACVGYVPKESDAWMRGADIVVQSFEEVDFDYLERIWMRKQNLPWTVMTTERTILREMTTADLEELYQLYAKPQMTDYTEALFSNHQMEKEYIEAYIENCYRFYGYGLWLVIEKESGRIIGRAGIENKTYEEQGETRTGLELGYLIDKDLWGRGLATEVCKKIMEFVRDGMGEHRLEVFIRPENAASIRVAKKLGFSCVTEDLIFSCTTEDPKCYRTTEELGFSRTTDMACRKKNAEQTLLHFSALL